MKVEVYVGTCVPNSPGHCRVVAVNLATRHEVELRPTRRPGSILHSPDGFAWGYQGSGPAQLAQELLRHHTGRDPHPALYQQFKRELVARWPIDDGWTLKPERIDAWLDAYGEGPRWLDELDAEPQDADPEPW